MRLHRRTPPRNDGPNPAYDSATGELYYGDSVATLTTNPPNLLLNPSAFVYHPAQMLPAELGPPNDQLFQSGETNAIPVNPAVEQGVGRAPGFQWAHYPHVQQFGFQRLADTTLQDGMGFHPANPTNGDPRASRQPIWPEGYLYYQQQPDQHQWWPHVATVNQPEVPAFVQMVPPVG